MALNLRPRKGCCCVARNRTAQVALRAANLPQKGAADRAQHGHLQGTDESRLASFRAKPRQGGATVDEPIETPNHAAGRGRKAWRAVRTAALLGTLGLAGMLMVEPPAAFNLMWSDAAAAQFHVPAADRWIALGAEDVSSAPAAATSAALPAIQSRAHGNPRDRSAHRDRSSDNPSANDRPRHRTRADKTNSRTRQTRNSQTRHNHSHSRTRTPMPTSRQA